MVFLTASVTFVNPWGLYTYLVATPSASVKTAWEHILPCHFSNRSPEARNSAGRVLPDATLFLQAATKRTQKNAFPLRGAFLSRVFSCLFDPSARLHHSSPRSAGRGLFPCGPACGAICRPLNSLFAELRVPFEKDAKRNDAQPEKVSRPSDSEQRKQTPSHLQRMHIACTAASTLPWPPQVQTLLPPYARWQKEGTVRGRDPAIRSYSDLINYHKYPLTRFLLESPAGFLIIRHIVLFVEDRLVTKDSLAYQSRRE